MKAVYFIDSPDGTVMKEGEIPEQLTGPAGDAAELLLEKASEQDNILFEKYIMGEKAERAEIVAAIRNATIRGDFIPVLCGSAFRNKGIRRLLDAVVD